MIQASGADAAALETIIMSAGTPGYPDVFLPLRGYASLCLQTTLPIINSDFVKETEVGHSPRSWWRGEKKMEAAAGEQLLQPRITAHLQTVDWTISRTHFSFEKKKRKTFRFFFSALFSKASDGFWLDPSCPSPENLFYLTAWFVPLVQTRRICYLYFSITIVISVQWHLSRSWVY